jgi:hypothetical protein
LAKPNNEVDKSGKSTKNIVYRDVLEGWSRCVILKFICIYVLVSTTTFKNPTFFYLQILMRLNHIDHLYFAIESWLFNSDVRCARSANWSVFSLHFITNATAIYLYYFVFFLLIDYFFTRIRWCLLLLL